MKAWKTAAGPLSRALGVAAPETSRARPYQGTTARFETPWMWAMGYHLSTIVILMNELCGWYVKVYYTPYKDI